MHGAARDPLDIYHTAVRGLAPGATAEAGLVPFRNQPRRGATLRDDGVSRIRSAATAC